MDNMQQQRDNQTNRLSEEHVQSAIEAVLANRIQSYDEFMESFLVLSPNDVNEFASRRQASSSNQTAQLEQSAGSGTQPSNTHDSSDAANLHGNKKQEDELEVEELDQDIKMDGKADVISSGRTKKFVQVDNYLEDEPDDESEFLSDDAEEELNFDDSSSNYVASFDSEPNTEGGAAKSHTPVTVTPEMVEKISEPTELGEMEEDAEEAASQDMQFVGPYPGEADEEEAISPSPRPSLESVHVTQLPHCTRIPSPVEVAMATEEIQEMESSTDVEPFSIDPDFDYDNVILTPKWQPGDMVPPGS
ncbi:uncharacterized protein [Diadema setosum]|uniref:uncharacterized protein n=1 Tax=Diadema setosum TaxID=31175 RepID=UPI003B3B652D